MKPINEKSIIDECRFLQKQEELLIKLIEEYATIKRNEVSPHDIRRAKEFVERSTDSEIRYLREAPEDYFEIYKYLINPLF